LWIDGTEVTDSNRIRVAELLGRSSGLFATDINVTTKERDSSAVAAEIEHRLAALLGSTADALTMPMQAARSTSACAHIWGCTTRPVVYPHPP
jgi:hypothetical protein